MRLIESSVELIEQGPGLEGVYKQIELAGRTAYKSEDKITDTSSKSFVDKMIRLNHGAALEHGTVYLTIPRDEMRAEVLTTSYRGRYSKVELDACNYYITTNYRVIIENGWMDDLRYLCEPTKHHAKRITVKWICDRAVAQEFTRHRVFSFMMESQRYCNYSKDKCGNKITFIKPIWLQDYEKTCTDENIKNDKISYSLGHAEMNFKDALTVAEDTYFRLLQLGFTPQNARTVLPNCTKTELIMTGFESDFEHFFDLRSRGTTGAPHPDAKYLADKLLNLMQNENK